MILRADYGLLLTYNYNNDLMINLHCHMFSYENIT